jgi:eukaryotic-like serine/threonine-protein kinase
MSMIGKTLAHYEITSQLGKGGMGEVYQAKDRKLGRDVAIKVLPEEFARDADRVARFQREAKLLASLNHPNIAAIYGLEEFGGTSILVLELVDGKTLADRIRAGPVPVEEALKLALQIAEALEAAHEKGIIHRDLKPENIKVTPEGKVKVLDFGLAKAFAGDKEEVNLSNSPTLSNAATQQGVILGTAAYMSPEQARGKSVDKRADIWAFGCVLYEMLTGQQTWTGTTVTDIMAAALAKDPDFGSLPPNIHPDIRKLLSRCLQKDPTERIRDVGDVRVEIKQLLADPKGVLAQPVATVEPRKKLRMILPWVAVTAILSIIVAGVAVWNLRTPKPLQVVRFDCELPEFQQTLMRVLAVSPDGKQFTYGTNKGLCLRSMDELAAKLIAGTEGASTAFFSPDGQWIGYFSQSDRKLKKIAVSGGAPVALCDVTSFAGASWFEDNTIVYGQRGGDIMRISADGGTPASLVKAKSGTLSSPQVLPGGKSLLYTLMDNDPGKIMVQSLKSGDSKELFAGRNARYLPTGHIVYGSESGLGRINISAVPFDLDKLEATGGAVLIVEGVGQYSVSDSGTLVYTEGRRVTLSSEQRTLVWIDRNGNEESLGVPPKTYAFPRVSPDGTQVALTIAEVTKSNIWIWDLARKVMTPLTLDETTDAFPLWTPDGNRIFFSKIGMGKNGVYWKAANGTGKEERLIPVTDRSLSPSSWSRDGKTMILEDTAGSVGSMGMIIGRGLLAGRGMIEAFASRGGSSFGGGATGSASDIIVLPMEGERVKKPLLQEKFLEINPQVSPDGRWMAYTSNESRQNQVYVRPFPQVESGRWPVSTNGGSEPRWSHTGRELFYRGDDSMMAVAVETEPTFKLGVPKTLFKGAYYSYMSHNWDLSRDGKRFLMIKPMQSTSETSAAPPPRPKITIVVNWFEELKQRVPVK